MTVIKCDDYIHDASSLAVISPVQLDQDTRDELDKLGRVKWIVAPNLKHHMHVESYQEAYPDAVLLVPDGIHVKKGESFKYDDTLKPNTNQISNSLEQYFIPGDPQFDEYLFYHTPSKTLIVADFFYGPYIDVDQDISSWFARIWFRVYMSGYKTYGLPSYRHDRITDKLALSNSLDEVLDLDFTQLICCHGNGRMVENPKTALKDIWDFVYT
eukprot:TRINITY_DN4263_c0_g8_i1.p1 TRINITY_DN4263_c0_g8~~TRINITY_DN4263_c0_g8_i1.p1  ORF type:complete len:213 (+),score=39.12 TRINITY_DN4263_c0_g8_i1:415-1053(+)